MAVINDPRQQRRLEASSIRRIERDKGEASFGIIDDVPSLRDGVARGREGAGRGDVCCERVFDQELGIAIEGQRRGRADAEAARYASAGAHGVVSERVSRSMYKAAR